MAFVPHSCNFFLFRLYFDFLPAAAALHVHRAVIVALRDDVFMPTTAPYLFDGIHPSRIIKAAFGG